MLIFCSYEKVLLILPPTIIKYKPAEKSVIKNQKNFMKRRIAILTVALVATIWSSRVSAQAGSLDPTWGKNGIVQTKLLGSLDVIRRICVQPDGKIIAMGSALEGTIQTGTKKVAFVRYNPDGNLDVSFGTNGIFIADVSTVYGNFAMDGKVLSDGKIIACGYTFDDAIGKSRLLVMRLTKDGKFDPTFGTNGFTIDDFQYSAYSEKMVMQKDGKIVVGGYYNDNFMTARYDANGKLDKTYGTDGMCVIKAQNSFSYISGMDIQDDGKIVVAGFYTHPNGHDKWMIARIGADGKIDQSFGEDGLIFFNDIGGGHDFATSVAIQSDGKILVGGHSWDINIPMLQYSTAIVRLNKDGSIDKSFGKSGLFRKRISEDVSCNYLFDLVIAPNGNIYAATSNYTYIDAESKTVRDLGVMSITKNGTLNTSFGTNGFASSDVDGGNDDAVSLAFTPNRKIVLGATSYTASGCKFVVLRYNTDVETGYEQPFTDADNDGKSFEVSPNPTKDILNINAKGIGSSYKVQIVDMTGAVVMTADNAKTVNTSTLSTGNYIIRLIADGKTYVNRFTKK